MRGAWRAGKSRTLGIIVSNMENPFFFDIFKAAETGRQAQGYGVFWRRTPITIPTAGQQYPADDWAPCGRPGASSFPRWMPHLIEELSESRMPVVFYDVGTPKQNISNVRVDYARGIEKAVDYLYDLGHTADGFYQPPFGVGAYQHSREGLS